MQPPREELTEKQLAEDFDTVQREVANQIREYEKSYPELVHPQDSGHEVVQQPVYAFDVHAAS